jgi:hypothetical protein
MPGIDPYMDWAYDHPHNVNQYRDTDRIDQDNELMGRIGLIDHVNEVH